MWTKHVWFISLDLVIQIRCSHRRIGATVQAHLVVNLNYFISELCAMWSFGSPSAGPSGWQFSITGNQILPNLESYYIWTPPTTHLGHPCPNAGIGLMPNANHPKSCESLTKIITNQAESRTMGKQVRVTCELTCGQPWSELSTWGPKVFSQAKTAHGPIHSCSTS